MRLTPLARQTALLGVLGTLLPLLLHAQTTVKEPIVKFGQVSAADFQIMPVPNDTTAEAVILYDAAETRYEEFNFRNCLITNYHRRVRINKKSGYDRATIERRLYGIGTNAQTITSIEGVTFTLKEGQVVSQKMDKAAIITEKVSTDQIVQKFTLPSIQEGCIIEYRYTSYSPGATIPATWWFQREIPVVWSDYRIKIPTSLFIKITLGGYLPLTINDAKPTPSGLYTDYHFAMANAPAFRDEPFITTADDYYSKIDFELGWAKSPNRRKSELLLIDWTDLDRTLLAMDSFGGQYQRGYLLRNEAKLLKAKYSDSDTLGMVTAAYEYIRHSIAWNGKNYAYTDQLRKVLDDRKGDSADINLLLIGFLREIGLDANAVILSTRDHGHVDKDHALLKQFNYVVAHLTLGGNDFLLDATDQFIKPGMLPRRALNSVGRLVLPDDRGRFISLLPSERDVKVMTGVFVISEDGEVRGTFSHSYGGYGAVEARTIYKVVGEEKFVGAIKRQKPAWLIERAEFANVTDLNTSMTVNYTLNIPDAVQVAGDRIYLRPLLTEAQTANPFKQPDRQFPVDFGAPMDETFTATYTLPTGYTVEELPKPLALGLPNNGGRFTYQVQQKGNQLEVVSRITIRKPIFMAAEYVLLKEFYDKILLKHGEQVVLVKGSPLTEKK